MDRSMDRSTDADGVSLESDGRTPTKDALGMVKTFRNSIRKVTSPLAFGSKGPKGKTADNGAQQPPSPSLSGGSPITSPWKKRDRKEEEDAEVTPQKSKGLGRSKTDPNMTRIGDSLMTRGASIRRSLGFGNKKDKDRGSRQEQPLPAWEGERSAQQEAVEEEEEEEEVFEEIDEMYELPELPHTPLSVMQINKLIEMEVLEEAHLNLLALRREFQQDSEGTAADLPVELAKKEKDLNLLYTELRNKVNTIVRDSNSFPSRNKALLVPVSRIIQEEQRRCFEPGGLPDDWADAWLAAVCDGVRAKVQSVHLDRRDLNASWLSVHLGLLGKTIVEDLESVKKELRWSYPPSFKVFDAYVRSYGEVTAQHLEQLEPEVTELRDLFALLDWIIHRYKSDRIMGSLCLQPEMTEHSSDLKLSEHFLKRLEEKYCCRVKEDMRSSLNNIIELENEEFWSKNRTPEEDENKLLGSHIPMDVWTKVKGNAVNSKRIDAQLEQRVISACLEELKHFPQRFDSELRRLCSPLPHWTQYQITYINSFSALQHHMENYLSVCPREVEEFSKESNGLVFRLLAAMETQFREDVKPYLRRMMSRKWLTDNQDFELLLSHTQKLSEHCAVMRYPYHQDLASRLHYHVAHEFVAQLMKNNYSCKNRKHEKAAKKISHQWNELRSLFEEMSSTQEWLHPVGDLLSDIIKQKDKTHIKDHLQPLVEQYPDFSKKHLTAVLYFRGLMRGREHQLILQRLSELKKKKGGVTDSNRAQLLFSDMQVTANTDCLNTMPFSCFNFLLPDN